MFFIALFPQFIDPARAKWPQFAILAGIHPMILLVLRFEGHTPEALERIQSDMLQLLRSVKPDASFAEAAH